MKKMLVHFPLHFSGRRISYTCLNLSRHMHGEGLHVDVVAPSRSAAGIDPRAQAVLGDRLGRVMGKLSRTATTRLVERATLQRARDYDCVYVWSDVSDGFLAALKRQGVMVFREKFNGLRAYARELLDEAYGHYNQRYDCRLKVELSEARVEQELGQLAHVDHIFCANPMQAPGYERFGLGDKLLLSCYGWDPKRIGVDGNSVARPRPDDAFTLLYVGEVCVRKGADLLLDAWDLFLPSAGGLKARLVFAGPVNRQMQAIKARVSERSDVEMTGWTDRIAEIYGDADVFAFPTHEEGGPLVTYEAMGRGMPVLVSPMGAGAIARDGQDGFIVPPRDVQGWADRMTKLARDPQLRRQMSETARDRAAQFTWDQVGAMRRRQVLEALGG